LSLFQPDLTINYSTFRDHLDFYFEDKVNLKLLTVKFEKGEYDRKKPYTEEELRKLLGEED